MTSSGASEWERLELLAIASVIDGMTREQAEQLAAEVLRDIAKTSFKRHRDVATATREASQLTHLAIRLEGFARG